MKLRTITLATVIFAFLFSACKKDNANQSLADKLAGTYQVFDTLTTISNGVTCANDESTSSYYIVVSKVNDNTIKVENFYTCGDFEATVTQTTIVETGGCGVSGTYSGTTLYMTYLYPLWA
jgi:hypothetical protein